jgi:hypothetical protein
VRFKVACQDEAICTFWLGWWAQSESILSTALNLIIFMYSFMYSLLGLQVDGDTGIGRLRRDSERSTRLTTRPCCMRRVRKRFGFIPSITRPRRPRSRRWIRIFR